jgi:hypothetical protein
LDYQHISIPAIVPFHQLLKAEFGTKERGKGRDEREKADPSSVWLIQKEGKEIKREENKINGAHVLLSAQFGRKWRENGIIIEYSGSTLNTYSLLSHKWWSH